MPLMENMPKSEFLQLMKERGYFNQCTDEVALNERLSSGQIAAYIGFDCTAQFLHVGHLMQIMILRLLQRCGHRPIVLFGGATTRIGDPSDKDEMRRMLSSEEIERNKTSIERIVYKFLDCSPSSPVGAIFVDNLAWLGEIKYLDFLGEYGRYFSINRMLTFESVKRRLDRHQPLTFLEFNYSILQGYDFVELRRRYDCILQFGGSEQWGNIISGIELGRRVLDAELFGVTTPLITTSSGAKMGKTAQGAVWIDSDALSSYDYWQFWRNVDDRDVERFLKLYTELSLDEIKKMSQVKGEEINDIKAILADEVTKLCHGIDAAKKARGVSQMMFAECVAGGDGGVRWDKTQGDDSDMSGDLSENIHGQDGLPTVYLERHKVDAQFPVYKLFVIAGLCRSGGIAQKLIVEGGAKINGAVVNNPLMPITENYFVENNDAVKLSVGKKRHCIVRLEPL